MIEVKNLTKRYGDHEAVHKISFTADRGIYGFLGPNGAGKTTTMSIMTGCLAATEGQVTINGHDIYEEPLEAKRCIGYLPEQPPLYPDMTPFEYLSFVGEAKGLIGDELYIQMERVMEATRITDVQNRLMKNLSKGYRQRCGIAQAMLGSPEIIILDEPTVGLDPKQIIEIRELVRSLGENHTVIVSSHILSEISEICDHVMIISKGRLVANDTLEKLNLTVFDFNVTQLTVRAGIKSESEIQSAVWSIDGVITPKLEDGNDKGIPVIKIKLRSKKDRDIREELFHVFGKLGVPILNMETTSPDLEDIFLTLTDAPEAEDAGETANNGDYTPMFKKGDIK